MSSIDEPEVREVHEARVGSHEAQPYRRREEGEDAYQCLELAPPAELDLKMPDEREPMPLTSEMPR